MPISKSTGEDNVTHMYIRGWLEENQQQNYHSSTMKPIVRRAN